MALALSPGTGPKYPRPKILVVDAPDVTPVLSERGYAAVSGSFGQPVIVQASAGFLPVTTSADDLPGYTEQEIIIADLAGPYPRKPGGQPPEMPGPGVPRIWAPTVAATNSTPAPVPSPDGTYQGSCDYTLSSSLYGKDHLIGEVDLHNTGNIGTVVKVQITWPQEGYVPIKRTKTVRTNPGQKKVVRFVVAVSSQGNVITLLQDWQDHHGMKSGCTFKASMISTFGSPQP